MKLYIRNMVCSRCKLVVKEELEKFHLHPLQVDLGEIEIEENLKSEQVKQLNKALQKFGFEIIDSKKSKIIEKTKILILDLVHQRKAKLRTNLSTYLAAETQTEYNYLSNLFAEVEGTTIEQYFIAQKVEKVKEFLVYDELTLSEIAFELNYSSVAHLSKQFKKVVGLAPSHFKELKDKKRLPIDKL